MAPEQAAQWTAIYAVGAAPAITGTATEAMRHEQALIEALRGVEPNALTTIQRIVLQNDAWGLHERLNGQNSELRNALEELMGQLALPTATLQQLAAGALPAPIAQYQEVATELVVLQHELRYGRRRFFSPAFQESKRALVGRLVAIDTHGQRYLTNVVGEIEHLEFDNGELKAARVWKLDRASLELREHHSITHVPDRGADAFFLRSDEPIPLATLPCAQCHDDDGEMSLPNAELAPHWRLPGFLNAAP